MKVAVVIPARVESARLPRKLLLAETGKPLIAHTAEAAKRCFDEVVVATEDIDIVNATPPEIMTTLTGHCKTGTERVMKVALASDWDIVVNWQGDEPELDGQHARRLCEVLQASSCDIGTLVTPATKEEYLSPNTVKAVVDRLGHVMYFSREAIPHDGQIRALKHIGLYAFKREFVLAYPGLYETQYPSEKLEQLQWIESGFKIQSLLCPQMPGGIDTAEEYQEFVRRQP
jgi:3-deoxy-manno-octulosonate cytidylyltransferase (CMP-KDO synthetase)